MGTCGVSLSSVDVRVVASAGLAVSVNGQTAVWFTGEDCCSAGLGMLVCKRWRLGLCEEADACLFLLVLVCSLSADRNSIKYEHICGTACSQYRCPDLHLSGYLGLKG